MSKLYYPAVFHEAEPDEKGYWVEFPDLPGCLTQGETLEEAAEMAEDALGTWFAPNSLEPAQDFPKPSNPSDIKLQGRDFVLMVKYDGVEWAKRYNNKAVKKTLTIPAWLNDLADKNNINYSQTLQDALIKKLGI